MIKHLEGDCREILPTLPAGSVQCCVTSPPYWLLRDYGVNGQLGLEATPQEYVANMVAVFRELWRVLKPDGTLWLNLGDSYATSNGWRPEDQKTSTLGPNRDGLKPTNAAFISKPKRSQVIGLKSKDLCGIPWHLAFALQSDGWYLRSDIIWHKPNPMPESVTDRVVKSHEYIFMLSKSSRYYFDADAIKEPAAYEGLLSVQARSSKDLFLQEQSAIRRIIGQMPGMHDDCQERSQRQSLRSRRDVWTIPTQPYPEAHFATFPEEIPKLCILAGSKPGDTILDPFAGSGTVGKVAIELGRRAILVELSSAYGKLALERTNVTAGFF